MKKYKAFMVDDELNFYSVRTGLKLKPHVGSDGYMQVTCRDENQKLLHERVHVVLAHLFVPNPFGYKYVNHIDSDKTNNSLENLEWCTNAQNVKHGWDSGNRTHCNRTCVEVRDGFGHSYVYGSIRELSNDLHLDRHKVARILKGEISNRYDYDFIYM